MLSQRLVLIVLSACAAGSAFAYEGQPCDAPVLSDQKVKDIVARERAARKDLPPPFSEFRWVVRKQGCYYAYIEYGLPEAPEHNIIFKLSPHGEIVDVQPGDMKCPERTFTEGELGEALKRERIKRRDLPAPYANTRTRLERQRCLYLYFEYPIPDDNTFQVFTFDPLGELMDARRFGP